jgi:hypothetical protein
MSDTFPMSLSGPACSSGAMPATMTGGAATVATTMPTSVSVSVATAVSTTVSVSVATAVSAAVSTTIPATATATAAAFGVGNVVSNDEAALAEFHGLGRPGAHDCDGQGRPGQPLGERARHSGPVTRRFGFDLHGYFSWGVADSF